MKVTEVTVNYTKTINLGNFENIKLGVEFKAEVTDNMSAEETYKHLLDNAKSKIKDETKTLTRKTKV